MSAEQPKFLQLPLKEKYKTDPAAALAALARLAERDCIVLRTRRSAPAAGVECRRE